jgi:hypothetical protein
MAVVGGEFPKWPKRKRESSMWTMDKSKREFSKWTMQKGHFGIIMYLHRKKHLRKKT